MTKFFKDEYKTKYNLFLGRSKMSAAEKTYKYDYLKKTKVLDDIKNNADMDFKIEYDDIQRNISGFMNFK